MRLFIAEKPSLGRVIADALPQPHQKERLFITAANGDIVTWAAGHILQPAPPDHYDPALKSWTLDALPIIPSTWTLIPSPKAQDLLANIKRLIKTATEVVHAGDADREGQLLIDEILSYVGYKGPVRRLLITDTSPKAVSEALDAMLDNTSYLPLSEAALCRQKADWMLGMSLSRLFTLRARKSGTEGVLSVGRVQTPTLGLVVARDRLIENFITQDYWQLKALFRTAYSTNQGFTALWKPQEGQLGLDAEGRLVDPAVLQSLLDKFSLATSATVIDVENQEKKKAPPLPHSLPSLQVECSKRYGLSPTETLGTLQDLYERGLVTYPRSDCPYLPTSRHADAVATFQSILNTSMSDELRSSIELANPSERSSAWNDTKVAEHFAIIPTVTSGTLKDSERHVYLAIAKRYIAQFLGPYCYKSLTLTIELSDELFVASATSPLAAGWKVLYAIDPDEDEKENDEAEQILPNVEKNQELKFDGVEALEKKTSPPKRFTEATLLQAMNSIHRYVNDPEVKRILKEVEGIGTAATQAKIIEMIQFRGYVVKEKKNLISTPLGRSLIDAVSLEVAAPDLTALWERQLSEIQRGQLDAKIFMESFISRLRTLVESGKATHIAFEASPSEHPCPACKAALRRRKGKHGFFWSCSACSLTLDDIRGKPAKTVACPDCNKIMIRRSGKRGVFWACTCGLMLGDVKGKPQKTIRCKCGGLSKQIEGKKGFFWACSKCQRTWQD